MTRAPEPTDSSTLAAARPRPGRAALRVAAALLLAGLGAAGCGGESPAPYAAGADADSVFTADVVPFLHARCEGCHFEGGEQYASMPFDDVRVVVGLGDRMLSQFETEKDRERLRAFLRLAATSPAP